MDALLGFIFGVIFGVFGFIAVLTIAFRWTGEIVTYSKGGVNGEMFNDYYEFEEDDLQA